MSLFVMFRTSIHYSGVFTNTDIILYFKCLDQTEELSAMDINFIEMEQSLRKQLKEDQKQTMNTIQSLCELTLGLFLYLKLIQIDANKG